MRRFHPSLALACGAALALAVAPTLAPAGLGLNDERPPPPRRVTVGDLRIRATLDHGVLAGPEERYLVVEVLGLEPDVRDALDIVLAIDRSGSMSGERLSGAKTAGAMLASSLAGDDRIGVVSFGSGARREVEMTNGYSVVRSEIWDIEAGGNTALFSGLQMAGGLLPDGRGPRRVILLSDGAANVGPATPEALADEAARLAELGISTSAIGLGTGIDHTALMAIADAGGGRYHYLSDDEGLDAAFFDELERLHTISASGVEVDLDLGEGVEIVQVYGYEEFDGRATRAGWSARIGDVSSGETRKIVARVRVSAEATESIAKVRVRWHDGESQAVWLPVRAQRGDEEEAAGSVVGWAVSHRDRALAGLEMMARSEVLRFGADQQELDLANRQTLEALGYLE